MKYSVVYDSTGTNLGWWLSWSPPLLIALVLVAILVFSLWKTRRGDIKTKALLLFVLVLFGARVGLRMGFDYYSKRNFYRYYGAYQVAEGVVEQYEAMRSPNVIIERFKVQGVSFEYADAGGYRCFHRPATNGGPMREGVAVRVSYTPMFGENCIVNWKSRRRPRRSRRAMLLLGQGSRFADWGTRNVNLSPRRIVQAGPPRCILFSLSCA